MSEHLTSDIESGSSLTRKPTHHVPTPTTQDYIERKSTSTSKLNYETNKSVTLDRWVNMWPTPTAQDAKNDGGPSQWKRNSDPLNVAVKRWPTPTAGDAKSSGSRNTENSQAHPGVSLTDAVCGDGDMGRKRWPTPQAHDSHPGHAARVGRFGTRHGGRNLNDWAARWPTPTADDANNVTRTSGDYQSLTRAAKSSQGGLFDEATNGKLNPTWVEWLMGFPLNWTDV